MPSWSRYQKNMERATNEGNRISVQTYICNAIGLELYAGVCMENAPYCHTISLLTADLPFTKPGY